VGVTRTPADEPDYAPCEACQRRPAEFWHKAGAAVCFTCFELPHDDVCALLDANDTKDEAP